VCTTCIQCTAILSSTTHFETCYRHYNTNPSVVSERSTQTSFPSSLSYVTRYKTFQDCSVFMGVAFSIFFVVHLGFVCQLEGVHKLTWECVFRSFVVNVCLHLWFTEISFMFSPVRTPICTTIIWYNLNSVSLLVVLDVCVELFHPHMLNPCNLLYTSSLSIYGTVYPKYLLYYFVANNCALLLWCTLFLIISHCCSDVLCC
jgi:hypothetical protein